MAYNWWLTPAVYAGISTILLEAQLSRARAHGNKRIYRASLAMQLFYAAGFLGVSILLYQKWSVTEWWLNLMGTVLLVAFIIGWPKTFTTDERGIECYWLGRKKVFIPWKEVEHAESGDFGAIKIVGSKARITFEGYNVDQDRFCRELTNRSSVKKIADPGELTDPHL
jgi:hypothetical protein